MLVSMACCSTAACALSSDTSAARTALRPRAHLRQQPPRIRPGRPARGRSRQDATASSPAGSNTVHSKARNRAGFTRAMQKQAGAALPCKVRPRDETLRLFGERPRRHVEHQLHLTVRTYDGNIGLGRIPFHPIAFMSEPPPTSRRHSHRHPCATNVRTSNAHAYGKAGAQARRACRSLGAGVTCRRRLAAGCVQLLSARSYAAGSFGFRVRGQGAT